MKIIVPCFLVTFIVCHRPLEVRGRVLLNIVTYEVAHPLRPLDSPSQNIELHNFAEVQPELRFFGRYGLFY